MKKCLALLAVLLAASAALFIAASAVLSGAEDAVQYQLTVHEGSIPAAGALEVEISAACDGHLLWDTRCRPGAASAETEFRFRRSKESGYRYEPSCDIYFSTNFNSGLHSSGGIDLSDSRCFDSTTRQLLSVYRDVAAHAVDGSGTQTVRLADYFDCYPFEIYLSLPEVYADTGSDGLQPLGWAEDDPVCAALREFFRIPIRQDAELTVTVETLPDGLVSDISSELTDYSCDANCSTTAAWSEQGLYFTAEFRDGNGGMCDLSLIPGGYGIYFLPFSSVDGKLVAQPEGLEMVFALDEGESAHYLACRDEELLLVTSGAGGYSLRVIERAGMTLTHRVPLTDSAEPYLRQTFPEDDFLAFFFGDDSFLVVDQDAGGRYGVRLRGALPQVWTEYDYYKEYVSVDWDGERFACVCALDQRIDDGENHWYSYTTPGFLLSVCSDEGVLFCGEYQSSLAAAGGETMSSRRLCQLYGEDPIRLQLLPRA